METRRFHFSKNKRGVSSASKASLHLPPWVVLSVDDEPSIHDVTRLVTANFRFEGRPLELLIANSGDEARTIMKQRADVALVLLDVVMESEHAGLDVAYTIREEFNNHYTRIILRTGQPGQAPQAQVTRDYDIDGYVEKTELVQERWDSILYSTLRAYRDICTIQHTRLGLERVIQAITSVNDSQDLLTFASALLGQLGTLIGVKY